MIYCEMIWLMNEFMLLLHQVFDNFHGKEV